MDSRSDRNAIIEFNDQNMQHFNIRLNSEYAHLVLFIFSTKILHSHRIHIVLELLHLFGMHI